MHLHPAHGPQPLPMTVQPQALEGLKNLKFCACSSYAVCYLLSSAPETPQGRPISSMQWGAWAGAGMAGQAHALASHLALRGIGLLLPQEGLTALRNMLQGHRLYPGAFLVALAPCPCRNKGTHHPVNHDTSDFGTCRAHHDRNICSPADMGQAAGGWATTLTLLHGASAECHDRQGCQYGSAGCAQSLDCITWRYA